MKCGGVSHSQAKQLAYNAHRLAEADYQAARDASARASAEFKHVDDVQKATPVTEPAYAEGMLAVQLAQVRLIDALDCVVKKHAILMDKAKEYNKQ
jgi:hypothetical protein